MKNTSIGTRIIILIVIMLVIPGFFSYFYLNEYYKKNLTDSLIEELDDTSLNSASDLSSELVSPLEQNNDSSVDLILTRRLQNNNNYEYIVIVDNSGKIVNKAPTDFRDSYLTVLIAKSNSNVSKIINIEIEDEKLRDVSVPIQNGALGSVHIGVHVSGIESAVQNEISMIIQLIITFIILGIIILILTIRIILRPLKGLVKTTESLVHGRANIDEIKTISTSDELGKISSNLNELIKRSASQHRSLDTKLVQSKHELEATSEALKASEIKYKSLVNNLRSAIITVNKNGDVLTINKGGIKLLGCKSKADAKKSNLFKDFGIPKEDCNTLIKLLREKGFVENFETILIKRTGEKAIIRISSQLIKEPDNQIERIDSIIRNITSLKLAEAEKSALEEELFHAEKLASIGQLAAGVAHEINNPLTNISLLTTSIRRKTDDDVILDKLDKLTQQRKIAAKIVNDLLQFSRKTEPKFKKLNLIESITSALDQVGRNSHERVTISNKTVDKDLWVRGDPDLLRQVFINIFENAYDEMPEGGTMEINSKPIGLDYIEIEVADTGPGVPENIIGKIFDPFFSTKQAEKGTGLGLSICHGIIKTHEGKIYAQNRKPKGVSFFIQLPRWIDEV